ncbi:MAG: hypothetical protein RL230_2911 [Pseudomonadota bacterium]
MLSLHFWRRLLLATTLGGVAVLGACGGGGGSPQAPTDGPQPSISSFSASPNSIRSGQSAVLTWSVKDATNVSIDNGIGTVLTQTSVTVNPLITTTYTLTASNARGSVLAATTLTVSPSPPPYPVGLTDDFLLVNGVRRDYRVHVPASLGGATARGSRLQIPGPIHWRFLELLLIVKVLLSCILGDSPSLMVVRVGMTVETTTALQLQRTISHS